MHTKDNQFLSGAAIAAVCFLLVHLMLIFRFAPIGDEIWDLSGNNWGIYIAGGRYTVSLLRAVFSECGVPVAYGVAASVFWGTAVAVQMEIFSIRDACLRFIYIAFSVGVVQLSYLMICSFLADAICFGLLCNSLAYWLFEQWLKERISYKLVLSVFLGVLGLGCYQLLAMLWLSLFAGRVLQKADNEKSVYKKALSFGIWCIVILICNILVVKLCKLLCSPADLAITEGYQATLVTWGQLDFITHVLHIGKQWVMHLIGVTYIGESVYVIGGVALLVLLRDIWDTMRKYTERVLYILFAISLYVLPFLPIAVLGEDSGARLFLSQSMSCAILCVLSLSQRIHRVPTWLSIACGIFLILKANYIVSDAAFYQKRRYEQTMALRAELYTKIANVAANQGVNITACPIVVKGNLSTPLVEHDIHSSPIPTVGDTFLEQYLGLKVWNQANKHDSELMSEFHKMPIYPKNGSIRYWNGKILVNLR